MQRQIDVYGVGGAFVDMQTTLAGAPLPNLDLTTVRGGSIILDAPRISAVIAELGIQSDAFQAGGSAANSISMLAQLGGRGRFCGLAGDDAQGRFFFSEFGKVGVEMGPPLVVGGSTGTVVILVASDAEKTMLVNPGLNAHLVPDNLDERAIRASKWLYLEGQLPFYGARSPETAAEATRLARQASCKVAVSLGPYAMQPENQEKVEVLVRGADLVFADHREAKSFTGCDNDAAAFWNLCARFSGVVVTRGELGAYVQLDGEQREVAAVPCTPIASSGAGDAFAGALLYALTAGHSIDEAVRGASFMAMKIVTQLGVRLQSGAQEYWRQAQEK